MAAGGRVVLRRGHGARRRSKVDEEEEEDEEYVGDEDEEEDEDEDEDEYVDAACSHEDEDEEDEDEEEPEPEVEDESDADFDGDDEELEDLEEEEIETPRPKRPPKPASRARKGKPARSRRRRHEADEDDDYEEEIEEEDEDFDPDIDEEEEEDDEVEEDDEELRNFTPVRAKKVRPRNHVAKRKPAAGRQRRKKKRSGSRVPKGKAKKATSARRRRKRWVDDDYEDGEEDDEGDEDFIAEDDQDEVNHRPRKKAKVGRKARDGTPEPAVETERWPSVKSDTSDFEFDTSDEEPAKIEAPIDEPARIKGKKNRRKWGSESGSSSDSDYVLSEEELKDLEVPSPLETSLLRAPAAPPRRIFLLRRMQEKGKEPEEAFKQMCGICLSEEQRATIQGVLNCCSHYFCFACILEWSKVESRCPLCKQRFNTITKSSIADLGLGSRKVVIRVEKRDQVYQPTEEEMRRWLDPYENVVCIECNQGGDDNLMLLCDICDSSAHTYCVGLGREVPEGNWYCGGCRSGGEGPCYAQTQDKVVHHGESYANSADTSSRSFGMAITSGVFQRPPPINIQPSPQEFDLNLSPRETPEEAKLAESHISADPILTPTGRHATLGRRRALSRRIRILLCRPRITDNEDGVQCDRTGLGTERSQYSTCTSTEMNPSCSRAYSQQSRSPFAQCAHNLTHEDGNNFRQIKGAKGQLLPIVNKCIKHIYAKSPLDESAIKNVARRATHTILALSGIAHNRDMVVHTPYPCPSGCYHACDGQEPAFLMGSCCSSCFNSFVADVVSHIADMFS